jgi:hypothetical protein
MPSTRTDRSDRGHLWEWWAEVDEVTNLLTGERVVGQRIHYREQGTRRWSTCLLTTSDGSMPTLRMFVQAMDHHSNPAGG